MSRFVKDLPLNKPEDFVQFIMNDFLQKNQFAMSEWKGEPVYRAGDAMVEGFKYLIWSYNNGVFHLEAWLKTATGKEMDLEGFVGCVTKKPYKESLEQLFTVLSQPLPNDQNGVPGNGMPQNGVPQNGMPQNGMPGNGMPQNGMPGNGMPQNGMPGNGPIEVKTVDNTGAATGALVLGIISVVFSFIIPLFGIIFACIGFSRVRMGLGSSKASQAKAGKVLCIIGMVISIVLWLLNIVLNVGLGLMA